MANVNVIRNPHLVTNIRDSGKPMLVDGVGKSQVSVTKKADHPLFGTCWYYPENEFNIISQHKANEAGWLVRMISDGSRMTTR